MAFSSEVDTGSREENASKIKLAYSVLMQSEPNMLEAAHAQTHLHSRRLYASLAADRLCARHHAGGDPWRRSGGGRVLRGAAAAQPFSRDLCRGCLQRRVRAGLCAS